MPWDGNTHMMNAPVGLGDISQAVHNPSLDLGTLISEGQINKWALYKPFVYSSWGWAFDGTKSTPALRQPGRETPMRSMNTGLAMRRRTNSTTAWTDGITLDDGGTNWKHIVPSGYFRALDFDGYNELAAAPFQYGPTPNPAYRIDTVQINDASGAGASEIELTDLMGNDDPVPGMTGYYYCNIRNYNIYVMLGKRSGSTPAAAPSLIYPLNATIPNQSLSDGTWDCVTIFSSKTFASGNYREDDDGIFVLAPVGRRSFVRYGILGLNYSNCEISADGSSLKMYLGAIGRTVDYYKMTVLIKNGSTVTHTIDLNLGRSGSLTTTQTYFGELNVDPPAVQNATFWLRFWPDSQSSYDEQFNPVTPLI